MAARESEGDDWMEKAEKKLKSFNIFGGGSKYEDAAEMFTKAANQYKIAKKLKPSDHHPGDLAGNAFIRAAECNVKSQSKHEAATNYVNAANAFKKCNIQDAAKCLTVAIEFFTDEGRFSIAAKHEKELAELFEAESDFEKAIEAYQTAAEYYDGEGSTSSANSCLLKVAQFSAQLENYSKAIELYEKVAKASLDNNLLKWSCKDYFFRATLCYLALGDLQGAKNALEKYTDLDVTFSGQREYSFLQEIITANENYDVEAFTNAVVQFDSVSKLDPWKTSILLRVKNSIKNEDLGLA